MRSPINPKAKAWLLSAAVAGGVLVGAAGVAGAATNTTSSTTAATSSAPAAPSSSSSSNAAPAQDPATATNGPGETLLTGTTADQVKAAALAAVPNATIIRVETDSAGSPYEAHVKKADGTTVTVKVDSSFTVTSTEDGFGTPPAGH